MTALRKLSRLAAAAALTALVTGCAIFTPVTPGMTREEAIAHAGRPSAIVPIPSGTRLQYSRQPAGQSALMVDLDSRDRVVAVREMMQLAEFNKIQIDRWTRADVEREFGRPAKVDRVYSWTGDIMTYRWKDGSTDMLYHVYLDPQQVVRRVGQAMDIPINLFEDR